MRISYLFIIQGFNDEGIPLVLHSKGVKSEKSVLSRIRRSQGLWRRLSAQEREQQDPELRAIIQIELNQAQIE